MIEDSDGVFNLRSSKCDVYFSNNDIYATLSPSCKSCRFLSMKMKKKLNSLTSPSSNISKFSRIDSISANPVKSNIESYRLRQQIVNLRRKMARLANTQRLKKEGQTINNVSDASLIKKIFTSANENVSKVLDTESKEMALWKGHYEQILAVNTSGGENTQTGFDPLLLKWDIYKEIAQVIHLPSFGYILRKTKALIGAQCVKKHSGVNLSMIQTVSKKLTNTDDVEEFYGSLGFDNMYIKAGFG